MALADVTDWMDEYGRPGVIWYAKRLAANDTLATNAHQAGPYIPKNFVFRVFPTLNRPEATNPDCRFDLYIDSHADHREVRAVWYNNKLHGGTRDETRLTNFGGRQSALLDPDSTGALAVFAFVFDSANVLRECHVWVCSHGTEADLFEERLGPVEPRQHVVWAPGVLLPQPNLFVVVGPKSCHLQASRSRQTGSKNFRQAKRLFVELLRRGLQPA